MCCCCKSLCVPWALQCSFLVRKGSLGEKVLLIRARKVGCSIHLRISYKVRPPPVTFIQSIVLEAYPCINKYFPSYLECGISDSSHTMATYEIRIASGMNLQQVAFLGAKFSSTDLLMDIILENPSREASNSMESRRALAKHRYNWALSTSPFGSDILVANKLHTPHLIEASAWVQYFGPDMAWGVPWSDEPGTFQLPPDCANARLYRFIENALQTDRKVFMRGRCHYCVSIKRPMHT